jgi:hypothetical protein
MYILKKKNQHHNEQELLLQQKERKFAGLGINKVASNFS